MHPVLLIDFGSTYTKLTAVDTQNRSILATVQSYTTAASDISIGFEKALHLLENKTGKLQYKAKLACSSAAGGSGWWPVGWYRHSQQKQPDLLPLGPALK